jgi:hypothetical protein
MFFSPWSCDFKKRKMDGWLDFQADGAAQRQARSQTAAGDRRTRSGDIGDIHTTTRGKGQWVRDESNQRCQMIDSSGWQEKSPS